MIADSLCKLVQNLFLQIICQLNECLHFFVVLLLIPVFLKLIVACRLCVIYVKEDND